MKIYTEVWGLQSFIIKGAFGKKSKLKPALFQPMNLIRIEAVIHPKRELQFISEVNVISPFHSFTANTYKSGIIIFISELLNRTLREAVSNPILFAFIRHSLEWLDLRTEKFADFHLYFMLELSRHLGFYPKTDSYSPGFVFDLMDGEFKPASFGGPHLVNSQLGQHFHSLCNLRPDGLDTLTFTLETRRELLNQLITYFQIHFSGLGKLHAQEVLSQLYI